MSVAQLQRKVIAIAAVGVRGEGVGGLGGMRGCVVGLEGAPACRHVQQGGTALGQRMALVGALAGDVIAWQLKRGMNTTALGAGASSAFSIRRGGEWRCKARGAGQSLCLSTPTPTAPAGAASRSRPLAAARQQRRRQQQRQRRAPSDGWWTCQASPSQSGPAPLNGGAPDGHLGCRGGPGGRRRRAAWRSQTRNVAGLAAALPSAVPASWVGGPRPHNCPFSIGAVGQSRGQQC